MNKITILKGLPASGKTTLALELVEKKGYKRVNKDDLRRMIDNSIFSKRSEKLILSMRDIMIEKFINDGFNVVVDDTNLCPKHERVIREKFESMAKVDVIELKTSLKECLGRDKKRENSVGEDVIRNMYKTYQDKYKPDTTKPKAYIFDIDGTLAKMKDRSPYDYTRVEEDLPNKPVIEIAKTLAKDNIIIVFSGREDSCFAETEKWLYANDIHPNFMLLRKTGDHRKDDIIKKEMFNKIKDEYNIQGIFDDRNQVVKMWRDLGLTCFQVDEGNF